MKKVKTSGILVIIGVIFSVMLVWAGYASEYFGAGESRAKHSWLLMMQLLKAIQYPKKKIGIMDMYGLDVYITHQRMDLLKKPVGIPIVC